MSQVSGYDASVLVYDESEFGVDPDPANAKIVYFTNFGLTAKQNRVPDPTLRAGRGRRRSARGNVDVSGPMTVVLAPEHLGFWLKHLLGAPVTTGASAPYTHVFVPKPLPPGFRIENNWTDRIANKVDAYKGLRMASGQLTLPQEGYPTLAGNLFGKSYSVITAPLDDSPEDPGHEGFTGFEMVVKHDGVQIGGVLSLSFQVDNEIESGVYCYPGPGEQPGSRFSLAEGFCVISGTLEVVFQDFTWIDLGIAGTETTLEAVFTRGTGAGTAGNETASFLVDHCDIPLQTQAIDTRSGLRSSIPFEAFADGSDMGLKVTLKNALATV